MSKMFINHYQCLKESMTCTNEKEYESLMSEMTVFWNAMNVQEQEIIRDVVNMCRVLQKAKNWVHDESLRSDIEDIVPKINRNQIFPW